jgi:small subunit ribosomal protein S13
MPRIIGVDLPKEKRIDVALTAIYGIGRSLSRRLLAATHVNPETRAKDITDEEAGRLSQAIQATTKVEGDLRREVAANVKRLMDINCYRGLRHKRGLPVRGQQTRTNARTRKGPRPRVGVRKRSRVTPPPAKTA